MEKEQKTLWSWVKSHRKQLLIAGISILAIIGIIAGVKNQESLKQILEGLKRAISNTTQPVQYENNHLPSNIAGTTKAILLQNSVETIRFSSTTKSPHDVTAHLRKLSEGRTASIEKIMSAKENGFDRLPPDYTWVRNYKTGGVTA